LISSKLAVFTELRAKLTISNSSMPFNVMHETRKLYFSGNAIRTLQFKTDFPNLQYLELASAQLTSLPANFGSLMSNVRVINLNYNAISDLTPLAGILRLKKLFLVGNRIRSLRKLADIMLQLPGLQELDLR